MSLDSRLRTELHEAARSIDPDVAPALESVFAARRRQLPLG